MVTVGSVQGGTRSNLIPDHALLQLNLRSYSQQTRQRMLAAIQRIVRAEGQASGSPRDPDFETVGSFPLTVNDPATTDRVAAAFASHFGGHALEIDRQTVSEDFSNIPNAAGVPYTYWGWGSPMRRPTVPPRRPDASRTFPRITPRNSCPRCSPPCAQVPRPWSPRPWPGSSLDEGWSRWNGRITDKHSMTPLGAVVAGSLAGAVGTVCLDVVRYLKYRRTGGKDDPAEVGIRARRQLGRKPPTPARSESA